MPKKSATAQQPARIEKCYRVMAVTQDVNVAPIDVDDLQKDDSVTIEPDDTILWYSGLGSRFTITAMKKISGPGPAQPFPHRFGPNRNFRDHVSSGAAFPGDGPGERTYKYTVLFEDGGELDPTVIIQE